MKGQKIEDFENGWHRQVTKNCMCIWSDEWLKNDDKRRDAEMNESAFINFGLLPEVCIHSPIEDEYSKMYIPRQKCDCGSEEWETQGCTMTLGYYQDKTPIFKDVHRCKKCGEVRLADHIAVREEPTR